MFCGIVFRTKQPSLDRLPARTSVCGRSPARDALQRISRKIPAHPCASRRDGVAQTVRPCTAEQSRRSIAATLRAFSRRACDARHRERLRLFHSCCPSMDCVRLIGWECALLLLLPLLLLLALLLLLPLLLQLLRQDAAQLGPRLARRVGAGKARQGGAQDARQFAACTGMYIQRTPEPSREPAGQDARRARHPGCVSLVTFFAQAKKVTRSPAGRAEALHLYEQSKNKVDSRLRGNGGIRKSWIPAFAGMTTEEKTRCTWPMKIKMDSRFRGNGGIRKSWIPAFAGMTSYRHRCERQMALRGTVSGSPSPATRNLKSKQAQACHRKEGIQRKHEAREAEADLIRSEISRKIRHLVRKVVTTE